MKCAVHTHNSPGKQLLEDDHTGEPDFVRVSRRRRRHNLDAQIQVLLNGSGHIEEDLSGRRDSNLGSPSRIHRAEGDRRLQREMGRALATDASSCCLLGVQLIVQGYGKGPHP